MYAFMPGITPIICCEILPICVQLKSFILIALLFLCIKSNYLSFLLLMDFGLFPVWD